ncbi:tyrosine-type recombinase/integrase [Spirillospora sp. CA-142024]|uniref:tyrosine-type recombinase/integrase n=1 Tax=Spirillospora sp. CA-142024 TaxID=3240036 RepID=UPI003D8F1471
MDPQSGKALGARCPKLRAGGRHGSWYVRLELPVGVDGRRRVRRGGFATRKAAEEALAQLGSPRGAGGGLLTVGEWLTQWLATRARAASTIKNYSCHVSRYLVPYLGQIVLAELSVAHLQAMFAGIARRHDARGAPLSAATLNRIRATLRTALNAAIRQGLISDNPASRVELPVARRPRAVVWTAARVEHWQRTGERPPVAVWTAAQTAEFLHAIREHRLYAAFHLIALRGLRRGEAAGLRWCDLDLDQRVAVISQQIQQHQGYLTACPPKTATSARVIALDRTTVAALRAHREQQQGEQRQAGVDYRDSGYVFTAPNGDPLAPVRLTRLFHRLVAEHGLPPIRLHDLRHGAATLALAAGVELKVVQDMLGHSSIVLTADTYTSVLPEVAHRAAERTAKHVLRAGRLVPGTSRVRRRDTGRRKRRRGKARAAPTRASLAHPARQLGRPQQC